MLTCFYSPCIFSCLLCLPEHYFNFTKSRSPVFLFCVSYGAQYGSIPIVSTGQELLEGGIATFSLSYGFALSLLCDNKALSELSFLYRFIQLNIKIYVFKYSTCTESLLKFSSLLQQLEYLQVSYFYPFQAILNAH